MEHISGLHTTHNGFSKRTGILGRVDCYVYVFNQQLIFAMDHNLYPGWEKIGFKKGAATYEFVDANDRNIHYDCRAIKEVRRGKTLIKVSSFDAIIPFKKDERLTRITLYTNEMSKGVKLVVGIEKVMNELRKANPREYIYS